LVKSVIENGGFFKHFTTHKKMENSNTTLIIFCLGVLFIILGIATFVQFQKMKKNKFKGEEKSEGTTSIVIGIGETVAKE
jgi:uncharacterized membrane protein YidH (DUF202 family)